MKVKKIKYTGKIDIEQACKRAKASVLERSERFNNLCEIEKIVVAYVSSYGDNEYPADNPLLKTLSTLIKVSTVD